jgi:hypothetical protein
VTLHARSLGSQLELPPPAFWVVVTVDPPPVPDSGTSVQLTIPTNAAKTMLAAPMNDLKLFMFTVPSVEGCF